MENPDKKARVGAAAGWFLEISALLFVFPSLDQLFRKGPFKWAVAGPGIVLALLFLAVGLTLTRG